MHITKEEAQIILNALDVATKAGGLQTAHLVLPIAVKLNEYAQSKDTKSEPERESMADNSKKSKDGEK